MYNMPTWSQQCSRHVGSCPECVGGFSDVWPVKLHRFTSVFLNATVCVQGAVTVHDGSVDVLFVM